MRLAADYPHLDRETIDRLAEYAAAPTIDLTSLDIGEARLLADAYLADCGSRWTPPAVPFAVEPLEGGGEAWIYRPATAQADAPILLWLHGGGWVFGSARLHQPWAREIASRTACPVVDLDYPLAPGHDLAAMVAACSAAIRSWSRRHPAARFILGGESAGATLALLVAAAMHDRLAGIVAVNPVIDLDPDAPYPSRSACDDPRLMQDWDEMRWFLTILPRDSAPSLSLIDRLREADLPPVAMIVGEYDLLRDEARQFAASEIAARTDIAVDEVRGAIHNSLEFGATSAAGIAMFDAITHAVARLDGRPARF